MYNSPDDEDKKMVIKDKKATRARTRRLSGQLVSCKRSQEVIGMSFNMIFSIILIIFFIVVAFIAIGIFWSPSKCAFSDQAEEGLFKQDLQNAISDVWNSAGGDRNFTVQLPGKIKKVCFLDSSMPRRGNTETQKIYGELTLYSQGNFYIYPINVACEEFKNFMILHVNMNETVRNNNPLCFDNGKDMRLSKGFNDALVTVR